MLLVPNVYFDTPLCGRNSIPYLPNDAGSFSISKKKFIDIMEIMLAKPMTLFLGNFRDDDIQGTGSDFQHIEVFPVVPSRIGLAIVAQEYIQHDGKVIQKRPLNNRGCAKGCW
jgi:hypothetical protein